MMRWLGNYFDQVSRERMAQRISGRRGSNADVGRLAPGRRRSARTRCCGSRPGTRPTTSSTSRGRSTGPTVAGHRQQPQLRSGRPRARRGRRGARDGRRQHRVRARSRRPRQHVDDADARRGPSAPRRPRPPTVTPAFTNSTPIDARGPARRGRVRRDDAPDRHDPRRSPGSSTARRCRQPGQQPQLRPREPDARRPATTR